MSWTRSGAAQGMVDSLSNRFLRGMAGAATKAPVATKPRVSAEHATPASGLWERSVTLTGVDDNSLATDR
ncbi:MAG: hypothetical protein AAFV53_07810 [Myxococcota bacterium]